MVINGDYDSPYLMIHEFSGSIRDFSGCQCQVSRLCDMTLEARSVGCLRCRKMVVLKKWIKTFFVRKSHINLHKSHDYSWLLMITHDLQWMFILFSWLMDDKNRWFGGTFASDFSMDFPYGRHVFEPPRESRHLRRHLQVLKSQEMILRLRAPIKAHLGFPWRYHGGTQ